MAEIIGDSIGFWCIASAPLGLWMIFLASADVSMTWLLTGTALALLFGLSALTTIAIHNLGVAIYNAR